MKNLSLLAALFLTLFAHLSFAQSGYDNLLKQLEPQIVRVTAFDQQGKVIKQATGFFVSEDGDILVPAAILDGAFAYEVKTRGNNRYSVKNVFVENFNSRVAVLSIDIPPGSFSPVALSSATLKLNETALAIRFKDQAEPTPELIEGKIVGDKTYGEWDNFIFYAVLPPPIRGVFLLTPKGELCGMVLSEDLNKTEFLVYPAKRLSASIEGLLQTKRGGKKTDPQPSGLAEGEVQIANAVAVKRVKPKYPREAEINRVRGKIVVRINIDDAGAVTAANVKDIEITTPVQVPEKNVEAITEKLKKAAIEAVFKWKFEPAKSNKRQIKGEGFITFNFIFR
jgi:hypothetical protein